MLPSQLQRRPTVRSFNQQSDLFDGLPIGASSASLSPAPASTTSPSYPPRAAALASPAHTAVSVRYPPTSEQAQAVARFDPNLPSLVINAYAGAGKTSTLAMIGQKAAGLRRRGLYLAFNKSIAEEAKGRFHPSVTCKTTHSLAYARMIGRYSGNSQKMIATLNANAAAAALSLRALSGHEMGRSFSVRELGHLVSSTVARFCQSAQASIKACHVPQPGNAMGLSDTQLALLNGYCVSAAERLWAKMIDPADLTPLGHDGYLKLWAMGNVSFPGDYVLLDEAQDSNPVLLDAIARSGVQTVYVGDRYQQIYSFRGAVNAMEQLTHGNVSTLTQSFRFGADIAQWGTRIITLLGATQPIQGRGAEGQFCAIESDEEHTLDGGESSAVIARTNASLLAELIAALKQNRRVFMIGGTQELRRLLDDVELLQSGMPGSTADFFGFANWEEVVEYVNEYPSGGLKTFVAIVSSFGVAPLRAALLKVLPSPEGAQITLTTAHKSKGREWPSVRLCDDFSVEGKEEGVMADPEELRLSYVASTRAQSKLMVPSDLVASLVRVENNVNE